MTCVPWEVEIGSNGYRGLRVRKGPIDRLGLVLPEPEERQQPESWLQLGKHRSLGSLHGY